MTIESTNDNNSTNTAITYSECYAQPFLLFNERNLDTMRRMPDNFIDLTVTSPPYDDMRAYKNMYDSWNELTWMRCFQELYRITKPGGVVVWVVGDKTENGTESLTSFKQAIFSVQCGFNLHDTMIWAKNSPIPAHGNRYQDCFEFMFVFSKGKPKTFNPVKHFKSSKTLKRWSNAKTVSKTEIATITGEDVRFGWGEKQKARFLKSVNNDEKDAVNIWYIPTGNKLATSDAIAYEHKAIFPEALADDHIISWSNEGDIVYDPFAGSGTTGKMAILNKRKCIMSEISGEYCEIIKKRLEPIINERTLF